MNAKKSLEEALSKMIQGETLEGDNAYYCDRCSTKRDAIKWETIKVLPNLLIIVLKRF